MEYCIIADNILGNNMNNVYENNLLRNIFIIVQDSRAIKQMTSVYYYN